MVKSPKMIPSRPSTEFIQGIMWEMLSSQWRGASQSGLTQVERKGWNRIVVVGAALRKNVPEMKYCNRCGSETQGNIYISKTEETKRKESAIYD